MVGDMAEEEIPLGGPVVVTEEAARAIVEAIEREKKPKNTEVEFEGNVVEIGLSGILVHFRDERQIWELKKKLRPAHPVRVRITLQE